MDAATGAILIEIAKGLVQVFFSLLQRAGMTAEEIDLIYSTEKATFLANKPELLPDV